MEEPGLQLGKSVLQLGKWFPPATKVIQQPLTAVDISPVSIVVFACVFYDY